MKTPPVLLVLALIASGCADESPTPEDEIGWYRAEALVDGYRIVRADPEGDTCIQLRLATANPGSEFSSEVEVGGDSVALTAVTVGADAASCTTGIAGTIASNATGQIELESLADAGGVERACTVDLDVSVDLDDGSELHLRKRDIEVWWPGCARPSSGVTVTPEQLAAAYEASTQTLIVAGWDADREACLWHRFAAVADWPSPNNVDAPPNWVSVRSGVARMEASACDPAQLFDPNFAAGNLAEEASGSTSAGSLLFSASQPASVDGLDFELPCELEIDVMVDLDETYHWVPDVARFQGAGILVAGACS